MAATCIAREGLPYVGTHQQMGSAGRSLWKAEHALGSDGPGILSTPLSGLGNVNGSTVLVADQAKKAGEAAQGAQDAANTLSRKAKQEALDTATTAKTRAAGAAEKAAQAKKDANSAGAPDMKSVKQAVQEVTEEANKATADAERIASPMDSQPRKAGEQQ